MCRLFIDTPLKMASTRPLVRALHTTRAVLNVAGGPAAGGPVAPPAAGKQTRQRPTFTHKTAAALGFSGVKRERVLPQINMGSSSRISVRTSGHSPGAKGGNRQQAARAEGNANANANAAADVKAGPQAGSQAGSQAIDMPAEFFEGAEHAPRVATTPRLRSARPPRTGGAGGAPRTGGQRFTKRTDGRVPGAKAGAGGASSGANKGKRERGAPRRGGRDSRDMNALSRGKHLPQAFAVEVRDVSKRSLFGPASIIAPPLRAYAAKVPEDSFWAKGMEPMDGECGGNRMDHNHKAY
jgi:hypothetical protein